MKEDFIISLVFKILWDPRRGLLSQDLLHWYSIKPSKDVLEIWDNHPDCGPNGRSIFTANISKDGKTSYRIAADASPFFLSTLDGLALRKLEIIVKKWLT